MTEWYIIKTIVNNIYTFFIFYRFSCKRHFIPSSTTETVNLYYTKHKWWKRTYTLFIPLVNFSFYGKTKKRTRYLCHHRCSWGLWWYNRTAATPWPANDIWSAAWWGRGDTPAGRHPGIPGDSGEDCQQEGGVIMGYCHRQVSVQGGLQHRPVCRSLLWPETTCLPLRHAVLRGGGNHSYTWTQVGEREAHWSKQTDMESVTLF